jgi:hypothetical protein
MRSEPPAGDELRRLLDSMKAGVLEHVASEPMVRDRPSIAKRITVLVVGIAALLGIGAGAAFAFGALSPAEQLPAQPDPIIGGTTPTMAPPVEYVVEGPREPESRYGLDCETLVSPELLEELFTEHVGPTDPLVTAAGAGVGVAMPTSIITEGGLVCGWSNGEPVDIRYGTNGAHTGLVITLLPMPVEGWSDRAERFALPADRSSCLETVCSADAAVGNGWLSLEAFDATAIDARAWARLLEEVTAVVSSAPIEAQSADPSSDSPLPSACGEWLPLDVVRAVADDPEVVEGSEGGGGWSQWAEARHNARNGQCTWSHGMPELATLEWVRDGAWAYQRMMTAGMSEPVAIPGLPAEDEASMRCSVGSSATQCSIDLRLGASWVSVSAGDREIAVGLATALVSRHAL